LTGVGITGRQRVVRSRPHRAPGIVSLHHSLPAVAAVADVAGTQVVSKQVVRLVRAGRTVLHAHTCSSALRVQMSPTGRAGG
jgi:hypothetical protein